MSNLNYDPLRANVSLLGKILGDVISDAEGQKFLEKVEAIRLYSIVRPAEFVQVRSNR